jgi:hypothetical protein
VRVQPSAEHLGIVQTIPAHFVGTAAGAGATFDEAPHLYDDEDTALAPIAREDLDKAAVIAVSDEWVNAIAQAPESLFQEDLTPEGDMWLFNDGETLEEFEQVIRVGMRQGLIGLWWGRYRYRCSLGVQARRHLLAH